MLLFIILDFKSNNNGGTIMAEKDTVMETEEKEVISKNFIEQEIDKDL